MNVSALFAATLVLASGDVFSQVSPSMPMPAPAKASAPQAGTSTALTHGVVTAVDKSRGFVTLNHEEIRNMGMPPMTMGFNVADKKMLDNIKTGDKVRFRVETVQGSPTVTRIEAVQR